MTTKVTKESLAMRIKGLEARGNAEYALQLTLEEEFKLEAYRMLLGFMSADSSTECDHELRYDPVSMGAKCIKCGVYVHLSEALYKNILVNSTEGIQSRGSLK